MQLFRAPFVKVFLRDNFAASIMCSFSHVLVGGLYSACYYATGTYLHAADPHSAEGQEKFDTCTESTAMTALRVILHVLPLCIRLFQCLRLLRDFRVAPWSQPPNNTTVDYDQQTSLDPAVDPATEWGYTWFSPMFAELEANATGGFGETDSDLTLTDRGTESPSSDMSHEARGLEMGIVRVDGMSLRVRPSSAALRSLGDSDVSLSDTTQKLAAEQIVDGKTEWGRASFNPLFDAVQRGPGQPSPDSCIDESQASHLDGVHSSGRSIHSSARSAHSAGAVAQRLCSGPVRVLRPVQRAVAQWIAPLWVICQAPWVWPHAMNAFQYVLQIMVVLIGAFPPQDPSGPAYITCFVLFIIPTVVYVSYWDAVVDCQLGQRDSYKPLLRKKLYYEDHIIFYYVFLFLNPIFRLFWMLSFTPFGRHPAFLFFEIIRRSMWAVLRMEVAYVQELARRRSH